MKNKKWTKNEIFLFRTQKLRAKTIPDYKKKINKNICRLQIKNDESLLK